jgi:peptidylprolyl isomerase
MSDLPKRAAALIGALLFLVTSAGLTIVVIWQAHQQSTQNTANQSQAASQAQSTNQSSGCTGNGTSETLPTPQIYQPPGGSVTTLQSTDLQVGSGQTAQNGNCLEVKYYGTLGSNGEEFDNNYSQPTTFKFQLGKGSVIAGWDQGLVGMKVGGTRQLVIPASLAYGSSSPSEQIPSNATLVFVIKLEKIDS